MQDNFALVENDVDADAKLYVNWTSDWERIEVEHERTDQENHIVGRRIVTVLRIRSPLLAGYPEGVHLQR